MSTCLIATFDYPPNSYSYRENDDEPVEGMGVANCQTKPKRWKMNETLRNHYILRNLEQRANGPFS